MKKFKLFQILPLLPPSCWLAAIALSQVMWASSQQAGRRQRRWRSGWRWPLLTGWNTEVYIFPTFKQMKTYESRSAFR